MGIMRRSTPLMLSAFRSELLAFYQGLPPLVHLSAQPELHLLLGFVGTKIIQLIPQKVMKLSRKVKECASGPALKACQTRYRRSSLGTRNQPMM